MGVVGCNLERDAKAGAVPFSAGAAGARTGVNAKPAMKSLGAADNGGKGNRGNTCL